jgi:hypothetical protein
MATGDYCTILEYEAARGPVLGSDRDRVGTLISVASRQVDRILGRRVAQDATTSTRHYTPASGDTLLVDDISTTVGLVVVDYTTTLTIDVDYGLFPTDGVMASTGEPGPYYQITKFSGIGWFQVRRGASVAVTARWGWPSVLPIVKEATILLVADLVTAKDNRYGTIGFGDGSVMRARANPLVAEMLSDYVRADVKIGIA